MFGFISKKYFDTAIANLKRGFGKMGTNTQDETYPALTQSLEKTLINNSASLNQTILANSENLRKTLLTNEENLERALSVNLDNLIKSIADAKETLERISLSNLDEFQKAIGSTEEIVEKTFASSIGQLEDSLNSSWQKAEKNILDKLSEFDEKFNQISRRESRMQNAIACISDTQETILREIRSAHSEKTEIKALVNFADTFALWINSIDDSQEKSILANKFNTLLEKFSLKLIADPYVPFDPSIHNACHTSSVPTLEENIVLEIINPGFFYKDELLSCATVVINRYQDEAETISETEADDNFEIVREPEPLVSSPYPEIKTETYTETTYNETGFVQNLPDSLGQEIPSIEETEPATEYTQNLFMESSERMPDSQTVPSPEPLSLESEYPESLPISPNVKIATRFKIFRKASSKRPSSHRISFNLKKKTGRLAHKATSFFRKTKKYKSSIPAKAGTRQKKFFTLPIYGRHNHIPLPRLRKPAPRKKIIAQNQAAIRMKRKYIYAQIGL